MSTYLYHCGTDGCCWLPLEPNVVRLDVQGGMETVTVLCPVCEVERTYPATPAVHLAVWRHRAVRPFGEVVSEAEQIVKGAARE